MSWPDEVPKVSVLIRTINRPVLPEAVASVIAQTYPCWEIVIVNASGQPGCSLGQELADRVTRWIEPDQPLSRSAAANVLLDAAGGDLAIYLDDDDWLLPDHLEKLVQQIIEEPGLVAAYSAVQCNQGPRHAPEKSWIYGREYDFSLLQLLNYLPIHAVMFRLDVARAGNVCRFDEGLALFEDWDFWIQLSGKGDFKYIPGVSAIYAMNLEQGAGTFHDNSILRESALERIAQRQLNRWRYHDLIQLFNWAYRRTQELDTFSSGENNVRSKLKSTERDKERLSLELKLSEVRITNLELMLTEARMGEHRVRLQLQSVLNSIYWRWTAPVRNAVRRVKRIWQQQQ